VEIQKIISYKTSLAKNGPKAIRALELSTVKTHQSFFVLSVSLAIFRSHFDHTYPDSRGLNVSH